MRHTIYISSVLAVVIASILAPLESRSQDVQPTKEDLRQALSSFIVPEAPPEAMEAAIAGVPFRDAYKAAAASADSAGQGRTPEGSLAERTSPGAAADLRLQELFVRFELLATGITA